MIGMADEIRRHVFTLPVHWKLDQIPGVLVFDVAVFHAVFVDEAGDFDVVGAIFRDLA